ncbi:heat shock protein HspQ [Rosenbergiella epipactidis]|uniref:heat shock protein HspQ n=1 Tax=Rosenbergiella epipactidis TaxID=1544694 RepID=UPI00066469E6|nr:heat shock protein HspQ [Rosenbergiella epipactidis]KMV73592.1 heat shock protein HspQ [bacteria symbiont BFo2 of Frankliniella occidentalis]KYP90688.1 heat shock protein HspQ [bacteria symbiont BFo2 of Frankliniella occidentalis]KYP96232.1 heat shock protein HspQ [bacteria symbiont BFo2 of Frankliniella occidentalis]
MIKCKFGIGQQVRHQLTGALGVIVDMDPAYALQTPTPTSLIIHEGLLVLPWYYVVMEDEGGETVQTYVAESQLTGEISNEHLDNPELDDIAERVRSKITSPLLRH